MNRNPRIPDNIQTNMEHGGNDFLQRRAGKAAQSFTSAQDGENRTHVNKEQRTETMVKQNGVEQNAPMMHRVVRTLRIPALVAICLGLAVVFLLAQPPANPPAAVPLNNSNDANQPLIPGARPHPPGMQQNSPADTNPKPAENSAPAEAPQTPSDEQDISGAARFPVTTRLVMAPTTVTTKDGSIVGGLTPADFQLFDNGKLQKITQDMSNYPLSLVIAVQNSYQVEQILSQVQRIGPALHQLVIGDEGEVALLTFSNTVETPLDFTSDPDKLDRAIKSLRISFNGQSNLNDATMQAVRMLRNRPANRRRIVLLISESRDEGSHVRTREVLNESEFANVLIYSVNMSRLVSQLTKRQIAPIPDTRPPGAVALPNGQVVTPTYQSQNAMGNWIPLFKEIFLAARSTMVPNPLEVFTTYTGGREFNFRNQNELDRAISDLGQEIRSQYLLTYAPNNLDEAGFHNIVVRVARPDLKVRTRDGYYFGGLGNVGQANAGQQ